MKKWLMVAVLGCLAGMAQAQVTVSNVRAEQRVGTDLVDIRYDVTAATPTVSVALEVRDGAQDGEPIILSPGASGHIGAGVPVGTDRHIIWDAEADWGLWKGTLDMRFTLTAEIDARVIGLSGDMAFGELVAGQTATRTLTIGNTGTRTLTVSGITYPAGFSGNWSGGTIAAGGSRSVTVTFAPTAGQSYSGNISVASDATSGASTRAASGTGVTRIIGLSGDMAFGELGIGQTATRTLTIGNTGNRTLTVSSIGYPAGFSGNWSGGTIAAGGSRSVTVTFAPTAGQSYSGNISVASDATSGASTRAASGTGIATQVINARWTKKFYANGHITMSDRDTGLMWVFNASANGTASWDNAIAHCNNLTYAGHSDWFLPNVDQLAAMYSQKAVFEGVQAAWYWSSTPDGHVRYAWGVRMSDGSVDGPSKSYHHWVWPCRSGQ